MDAPLAPVPSSSEPTPPAQQTPVVATPTTPTPATPTPVPALVVAQVPVTAVPVNPATTDISSPSSESNGFSGGSKKLLFAVIGIVIVLGLAAAAYFTMGGGSNGGGDESAPPSLTLKIGGAKGSFVEQTMSLLKFEQSDIDAFKAKEDTFKSGNVAAVKLKSGVNYVYAEKEISYDDVVGSVDPLAGRMAVASYDASAKKFLIYPAGPFEGTQEVKQADLKTTKIPAGSGFVVMVEKDANLYGSKFGTDKSTVAPTFLAEDKTGWQLVAVNDASLSTVLKVLVDKKRIGSVWAQKDDAGFEKVGDIGSYTLKKYLVWVNVKAPGAGGNGTGGGSGAGGGNGADGPSVSGFGSDSPKNGEQGKSVTVKIAGSGLTDDADVLSGSTGVTVGVKSAATGGASLSVTLNVAADAALGDMTLTVTPKGGSATQLTFTIIKPIIAALAAPTGLALSYVDGSQMDTKSVDPTKFLKLSWNGPLPSQSATQSKDTSGSEKIVSYHMKFTFGSATFDVPFNSLQKDIVPDKDVYVTTIGDFGPEFVNGGAPPSGKTSVADLCFVSIYAGQKKHQGKDWTCDFFYLPPSILKDGKLQGVMQYDSSYAFTVTVTDDEAAHESAPATLTFSTTANISLSPASGVQGQQGLKMTITGNGLKDAKITTEKTQLTATNVVAADDGKTLTFVLNIADDIAAVDWTNIVVTRKDGTVTKLPFAVYQPTVYTESQKVLVQGSKDVTDANNEFQWYVANVTKVHDQLYDVMLDTAAKSVMKNLKKNFVAAYEYHPTKVSPKQVVIAAYKDASGATSYWMATVQSVSADGKVSVELYTPAKNKIDVSLSDIFAAGDAIGVSQSAIDAGNVAAKNEHPDAVSGISLQQGGIAVADVKKVDIFKSLVAKWDAPKILNGGAILQSTDQPVVGALLGKQLALSYAFSLTNDDTKKTVWDVKGDLTSAVSGAEEDASCKKQIWYQSLAGSTDTIHGWTCTSVTIPAKLLEEGAHYSFAVRAVNAATISTPSSLAFQMFSSNVAPAAPGGMSFSQGGAPLNDPSNIDVSDATKLVKISWMASKDDTILQSTDKPGDTDTVGKNPMLSYQVVLKNLTDIKETVLISDDVTAPVNGTSEDTDCVKPLWRKVKMTSQTTGAEKMFAVSHSGWTCASLALPKDALQPGKSYKIRVQASDGKLMSDWMEGGFATTTPNKENIAPTKPQNVSFWQNAQKITDVKALDATKPVKVQWDTVLDNTIQYFSDKEFKSPLLGPTYSIQMSNNTDKKASAWVLMPDIMKPLNVDASGDEDSEGKQCRTNVYMNFENTPISTHAWSCPSITLPATYLTKGSSYTFNVRADDGKLQSDWTTVDFKMAP